DFPSMLASGSRAGRRLAGEVLMLLESCGGRRDLDRGLARRPPGAESVGQFINNLGCGPRQLLARRFAVDQPGLIVVPIYFGDTLDRAQRRLHALPQLGPERVLPDGLLRAD